MSSGSRVSVVASRGSAAARTASPNDDTAAAPHNRPNPPRQAGALSRAPSTLASATAPAPVRSRAARHGTHGLSSVADRNGHH